MIEVAITIFFITLSVALALPAFVTLLVIFSFFYTVITYSIKRLFRIGMSRE